MSEFGSAKSYSSVSESSASYSSSQPSSGSSSSEETHTCHRCGDCCFSDKSRIRLNISNLSALGPGNFFPSIPYNTQAPDNWPEMQRTGNGWSWVNPDYPAPINSFPDPVQPAIGTPIMVSVVYDCVTGTWSGEAQFSSRWENAPGEWMDAGPTIHFGPLVGGCCGASASSASIQWSDVIQDGGIEGSADGTADIAIEVHNNPCCTQEGWHDCFQHFNGDCRGDCDEPPPSSSDSSSEENPLP